MILKHLNITDVWSGFVYHLYITDFMIDANTGYYWVYVLHDKGLKIPRWYFMYSFSSIPIHFIQPF